MIAHRLMPLGFALLAASAFPAAAANAPLTVVELFQSQGCSSCPPANANLMALSDRPDLLTLSFGVTYWDQLGWKDTFGSPRYTARQWDYAHAFRRGQVFTPQIVVNGHSDVVGQDRRELEDLIRREGPVVGPEIHLNKETVDVAARSGAKVDGKADTKADVWLVRFDPRIEQVPVARGENAGLTLPHRNVVKDLVKLGEWTGTPASYRLPAAADPALKDAILIQAGPGGVILAAARD